MNFRLSEAKVPQILTSRELVLKRKMDGTLANLLKAIDRELLDKIIKLLKSKEIQNAIIEGKITIALIKPMLVENGNFSNFISEDSRARIIVSQIPKNLEIIFDIVLQMDSLSLEEWYGGLPKQQQMKFQPIDPNRYGRKFTNRWEEFKALIERGPVTFLILYSSKNNAIEEWRKAMGNHWDVSIAKKNYPGSLRAKFANDNHNNIFHGSDSVESVERELQILINLISRTFNL